MSEGTKVAPGRELLEQVGKALGLVTALLPAAGFVNRYVSFRSAGIEASPTQLAWSAPLAQLVVTGLVPLSLFVLIAGLLWWFDLREGSAGRRRAQARAERQELLARQRVALAGLDDEAVRDQSVGELIAVDRQLTTLENTPALRRHPPGPRLLWVLVYAAIILAMVLFVPAFPLVLLAFFFVMPIVYFSGRAAARPTSQWFSHAWPGILVLVALSSVLGGLFAPVIGPTPGSFVFASRTGLPPDGRYRELAKDGGLIYITVCGPARRRVFAVTEADVVVVRPEKPKENATGPSLWRLLTRKGVSPTVGLPRC